MLSQKLYIPASPSLPRPWRVSTFAVLLFILAQVVTPTQLDWVVPLAPQPVAPVLETTAVMNHQPDVVTEIGDLWTWRARDVAVVEAEPLAPWDSTVTTAVVSPDRALFHADLQVGRDNIAQFSDGAVSVFVEADTFATPTTLEFLPIYQGGRSEVESYEAEQARDDVFYRFQIEARDEATGDVHSSFDQPVRLILNFDAIDVDLSEGYDQLYLAYQDAYDPAIWHGVDFSIHPDANSISADLPHFSSWITGERPEAWGLNWSPPVVSEFSGAVNYGHPIEIPPGRSGLQPSVSLSYNSRSMDGHILGMAPGFVANGWSLAHMSISRVNPHVKNYAGTTSLVHPDEYSLVLDGVGYNLVADANHHRYYAQGNPSMRIYRHYDSEKKYYWTVEDGSGTKYTLGDKAEAETWQCIRTDSGIDYTDSHGSSEMIQTCPTNYYMGSALGWYVTKAEDQFGNTVGYTYLDGSSIAARWSKISTKDIRIKDIYYNYNSNSYNHGNPAANAQTHIAFFPTGMTQNRIDPVEQIKIYHGGSNTLIGEYDLDVDEVIHQSNQCSYGVTNELLKSITYSAGGYSLPPTTFTYEPLAHMTIGDLSCYYFHYLKSYKNGYGGEVTYTYESDWRFSGGYSANTGEVPHIGYSYRVSTIKAHDGFRFTSETSYDYQNPCYRQYSGDNLAHVGAADTQNCHAYIYNEAESRGLTKYAPLMGHQKVAVTVDDLTDSHDALQRTVYEFHTTPPVGNRGSNRATYLGYDMLMGKAHTVTSGYPSGTWAVDTGKIHQTTTTTYRALNLSEYNAGFRPVELVTTTHEQSGASYSTATKYEYRTDPTSKYQYQDDGSGAIQLGRVTHINQYVNGQLHSLTRNWYRVKETGNLWLIRQVRSGDFTDDDWEHADTLGYTYYLYDGLNRPWQTDNRIGDDGLVTAQVRNMPHAGATCADANVSGCESASQAIVSQTVYDSYGNPTKQTSYADYGYWSDLGMITPSGNGRDTQITYDSTYKIYPLTIQNALSQTTTLEFYGINGVSMDNNGHTGNGTRDWQTQVGALRKATDTNGNVVIYEYDPFGRLWQTFDSESAVEAQNTSYTGSDARWHGNPMSRTRYWDNTWENGSVQNVSLDPSSGKPFFVTAHTRPAVYNTNAGEYALQEMTFFNGFGQAVQTRSRNVEVDGVRQDVVTYMGYTGLGQAKCQSTPVAVQQLGGTAVWDSNNPHYITGGCVNQIHTETEYYPGQPGRTKVTAPSGDETNTYHNLRNDKVPNDTNTYVINSVLDAMGNQRKQISNALGQLTYSQEFTEASYPSGFYAQTKYEYDIQGNLTHVTDAQGNVSEMGYDTLGRKTSMDDPDMGEWAYEYDAAGNLTEQLDANGNRLCFYYDKLNRMTHKTKTSAASCPSSPVTSGADWLATYEYDTAANGKGLLAKVSWAPDGALNYETFTYDTLGRATSHTRVIDGQAYTMKTVEFDELNRPIEIEYPDGEIVEPSYDREGENTLTVDGQQLVQDVQYNERGQMTLLQRNGTQVPNTTYSYKGATGTAGTGNSNFRLHRITHGTSTDDVADYIYQYDMVGNITGMQEILPASHQTQSFFYDHLYRLVSASANTTGSVAGYGESYDYDEIGNMTEISSDIHSDGLSADVRTYSYLDMSYPDRAHAVKSIQSSLDGTFDYSYDANGNMVSRSDDTGMYEHIYDSENRLVAVLDTSKTMFADDFDTKNDYHWVYNEHQTVPYGDTQAIRNAGTGSNNDATLVRKQLRREEFNLASGDSVTMDFKVSYGSTQTYLGVVSNHSNYERMSIYAADNKIYAQIYRAGEANELILLIDSADFSTNNWYTGSIVLDDRGGLIVHVKDKNDPALSGTFRAPITSFTTGKQWRFQAWTYASSAHLDNYSEQKATIFSYDASGQRVSTTEYDGTESFYPFPQYEESHVREETLTIRASGTSANGTWPNMELWVNGAHIDSWTVDSSLWQDYTAKVHLTGNDQIDIRFTNDNTCSSCASGDTNVNLKLDYYKVGSTIVEAESNKNWIDRAHGSLPDDGDDLMSPAANPNLYWNGALRTVLYSSGITAASQVTRKTYMLAGQPIATKVSGHPDSDQNGLFYIYTDHLGSASTIANSSGQVVDTQRFLPFGERRTSPTTDITERGFTGHHENREIGLTYMNARFYVPYANRFLTPDSIIPDPANPQSFNRYSYVNNNPIRFNDPSGHIACEALGTETCNDETGEFVDPIDPVVEEMMKIVGQMTWQNPTSSDPNGQIQYNDFYNYFVRGLKDAGFDINSTCNCWESILFSAYNAGLIDENWIKGFYLESFSASDPNQEIWDILQNGGVSYVNGDIPEGSLVFFTSVVGDKAAPYPGHVALATGGNNVLSLWSLPADTVQSVPYTDISNSMIGIPFGPEGATTRVVVTYSPQPWILFSFAFQNPQNWPSGN